MPIAENETIGTRLNREVLEPLKRDFVGKEEIIDLLGVALIGGENLFILGPPGTAKSAIVQSLGQRLHGHTFSYLLTRFTEPSELFGPFDIRRLREGELTTNTEGMLTEASLVFLDELLNANSAILNSLLSALNERSIHRGRERIAVQALMFVGASNHLPEDDALNALFDRFLLRVHSDNVPSEQLTQVLEAGWRLEHAAPGSVGLSFAEIRDAQKLAGRVSLEAVRAEYVALVHRIRHAGIRVSDRRAVKLQRVIAASALLCGREEARASDLWVLRYIWDSDDQQEVLRALVNEAVAKDSNAQRHPLADGTSTPDAEALARDLEWLAGQASAKSGDADRAYLRDRLAILDGRVQWVRDPRHREGLLGRVKNLWETLAPAAGAEA
jgi:MoxR-like ATPase